MLRSPILFSLLLLISVYTVSAQDESENLLELLGEEEITNYSSASFKTSLVINLESIENTPSGVLDFKVMHRFGALNGGFYEFFGLDQATTRLGLKYGINRKLEIGLGRSTLNKNYDGSIKWKMLRQSSGLRNMPISLSPFALISYKSIRYDESDPREIDKANKLNYSFQIISARKFSERLTLQLVPSLVHRNFVETSAEKNDVFSLGFGGRIKLSKRISLNLEYFYNFPDQLAAQFTDPFSIGIDLETGGHVFQLLFTNSSGMVADAVITETTGKWGNGDIRFGFNISRVFTIVDPQKEKVKKEKAKE